MKLSRGTAIAVAVSVLSGSLGCAGPGERGEAETLTREAFVETYTALRQAAMQSSSGVIAPEDRERVLAEQGVSEDELASFAETHGADDEFMRTIWEEVQEKITEQRTRELDASRDSAR